MKQKQTIEFDSPTTQIESKATIHLDQSISLFEAMPESELNLNMNMKVSDSAGSSLTSDIMNDQRKDGKPLFRSFEKHKQQAFGRPDDWVGPTATGSRRKSTKSWRRKETSHDANSLHSAPPTLEAVKQSLKTEDVMDEKENPLKAQTLSGGSLHSSFTFQDLLITTDKECSAISCIDGSQHSVLTEDSKSRFSDLLKMWNSSTSLGPCVVQEGEDEDESHGDSESPDRFLQPEQGVTHSKAVEADGAALFSSKLRDTRRSSRAGDKKPFVPELEESFVSATESDSITWKSFGTMERGLRPSESLPLRPTQLSRYHKDGSTRSIFSTNDSVSSSANSSRHGHQGHNRPDSWVGEQSKPSKRSWRPKSVA